MNIIVNHLGFRPQNTEKKAIIWGKEKFTEFQIVYLTEMGYNEIGPNSRENSIIYRGKLQEKDFVWGKYFIADFSDLKTPGFFLITLNNQYNSVPFQIRDDIYSRTLRKAFEYIHIQRCGQAVPNYHGPCHLDDAIRRDTGEYVDTVGGWHDAGDLRKWMEHTLLLGIAINILKKYVDPDWRTFNIKEGDLLDELRWGNQYFLKMLSPEGQVWNDVAAGIDGDNSDNHWTDNIVGTKDDRHINTFFNPVVQWEFIYMESLTSATFKETDPYYSRICLQSALKAYEFVKAYENKRTVEIAWAILALKELYTITGNKELFPRLEKETRTLLSLQETEYMFGQDKVKGFWYYDLEKNTFYKTSRDSGIPIVALIEVSTIFEKDYGLKEACINAVKNHCLFYIKPLSSLSPFGIIPYSLFNKEETLNGDVFRPIEGGLYYRFFPEVTGKCAFGTSSHLLSYAVGLKLASDILNESEWEIIGRKQLEWVMGANTENACLMTGEGINNPYPHSRFLGLIPGGIMNGIAGTEEDLPLLDKSYSMDWRTTEYWSPHVAFYIWFVSLISKGEKIDKMP